MTVTNDSRTPAFENETPDMELDQGELTLGDLEDAESVLGFPLAEVGERPGGTTRLATAMIWIRRRKLDPTFTFEQARALPIGAMIDIRDDLLAVAAQGDAPPPDPSTTA